MKQRRADFYIYSAESKETYRGEFCFFIDGSGRVIVNIRRLCVGDGDGDFFGIAQFVQNIVRREVIRKLSDDMDAFRYSETLTVPSEEPSNEKVVRELS